MARFYGKSLFDDVLSKKNWEQGVLRVCIEACDCSEDPFGYRAVFFTGDDANSKEGGVANRFIVGASFLLQRKKNLMRSGYEAPMTEKAIALLEGKIGSLAMA